MNLLHHWLCRSTHWRRTLQERMPWTLSSANFGSNVLEVGPGPGLTTDILRRKVPHVTAIEADPSLAHALRVRMRGSDVEIIDGDATAMPFADAQFSGCVAFTMLHHVPSHALQDRLLRGVWRVLKPNGVFVGSDSLQSLSMRLLHIGDTYVPVDPDTFGGRLESAGFVVLELERGVGAFRFYARRP